MKKKSFLTIVLAIVMAGGVFAQTVSPSDELDLTMREVSDYFNNQLPRGNKLLILNIQSEFPALSEYIIDELITNTANDGVFPVVKWDELDAIRADLGFHYSGEVGANIVRSLANMLEAQIIVSGEVSRIGGLLRLRIWASSVEDNSILGQFNRYIHDSPKATALIDRRGRVVPAAGGASRSGTAQGWNRAATVIDDNNLFINAGIGFGPGVDIAGWSGTDFKMAIPPISASVDFKLPIEFPITLGAIIMYTRWDWSYNFLNLFNLEWKYSRFGFGLRGMYHFNLMENLDTYAGLTLGYVWHSLSVSIPNNFPGEQWTQSELAELAVNQVLWGLNIGARYFFTDYLGAYIELGYSSLQYVGAGLTVKF